LQVTTEAKELAEEVGVRIFTADIIYHLFDQFTAYMNSVKEEKRKDASDEAVFPCVMKIMPQCVFNKKDPIIVGVEILDGVAKVNMRASTLQQTSLSHSSYPQLQIVESCVRAGLLFTLSVRVNDSVELFYAGRYTSVYTLKG